MRLMNKESKNSVLIFPKHDLLILKEGRALKGLKKLTSVIELSLIDVPKKEATTFLNKLNAYSIGTV